MRAAIISGTRDQPVEDISISDVFMVQNGGGSTALASINPSEQEPDHPEPNRLGPLPAQGIVVCHARNLEVRHIEIAHVEDDVRPCVWLNDVDRADFIGVKLPLEESAGVWTAPDSQIAVSGSAPLTDAPLEHVANGPLP